MKFFFSLIFICFITYSSFGQKLYIWCPEQQEVKPRTGFLENQIVNLTIFDGRMIPVNSKVECQSDGIEAAIYNMFKEAYPSAKIILLKDSGYYKKAESGKITIKIGISAYQAGFGTDVTVGIGNIGGKFSYGLITNSKWNGITSYYAQIFDNRNNGDKKYDKAVSKVESKSNIWGYKTAKTCLNMSYAEANQDLLFFIDKSLME